MMAKEDPHKPLDDGGPGFFTFQEWIQVLASRWRWLPILIVIGGLVGIAVSWLLPPSYRAKASLGIGIDYGRTHSLSPDAEREALFLVQELLLADQTLEPVLDEAPGDFLKASGVSDLAKLRELVRIERYEGRWDLSIASADPDASAALTNAWAQSALSSLTSAVQAAIQARELQSHLFALGCQLQKDESTGEAAWTCGQSAVEQQQELAGELAALVEQSHGILPGLTFAQLRQASPPDRPVSRARLWLVIGGLLIGASIGMAVSIWPLVTGAR